MDKEKLTIDGDSLLMIYIYVTIRSKCLDLFSQIKFINEFSTPFVRTTKLGYCTTTLEIAINHILMLTKDELFSQ
jgi:Vacuolar sorting protein 9 (VPS9) domain